ncbi:MAG TPA: hypothetical protein VGQ59_09895 [Cyclobacteriaceae bacterium]|jgi:hypothetical protein|nr:hypothetical protein [Cyclobacteriaceae bacterium]
MTKHRLHASALLPEIEISRGMNPQNGNNAEEFAASNVINAFNAELRWGSRNEDNKKIDLILSFDHPWKSTERIILLVQIKSGNSYGRIEEENLVLKKRAFAEVKRHLNSICLFWVDNASSNVGWAYIHPNTSTRITRFGKNHFLNPSIRFEIARCITKNYSFKKSGGTGIHLKDITRSTTVSSLRKDVRTIYREMRRIESPLLGEIVFSSLGWKHMFRRSRRKKYKEQSLIVIPYLKNILRQLPTAHWINCLSKYTRKDFEFWQYEYVLRYENVKFNNEKCPVVIKIFEEIGYPFEWRSEPLLSQRVVRRVVFKSCNIKT